jgi:hypothetical protein
LGEVDRTVLEFDLARFDLGEIEDVVDEAQEVFAGELD